MVGRGNGWAKPLFENKSLKVACVYQSLAVYYQKAAQKQTGPSTKQLEVHSLHLDE
jgi:hypothetical protein